jgi:hypothetical protein
MSKKNNKSRGVQYANRMKEIEKNEEKEKLRKQERRDTNRAAKEMAEDLEAFSLLIEKEERMTIEKPNSQKKQKRRFQNKKSKKGEKVVNEDAMDEE